MAIDNNCQDGYGTFGFAGLLFSQLINFLLKSQCDLGGPHMYPTDQRLPLLEYDFIVVGAGSAGSVVANRLSEVTKWNILLVEAGGDPTINSDVPGTAMFIDKELNWGYKTEPTPGMCEEFNGNSCVIPRGKGLGGSSTINFLIYVRGNKNDFNHWEELGNAGWGYHSVLNYFKKSEDIRIPKLMDSSYHGKGGYLGLESILDPELKNVSSLIFSAAEELGLPILQDLNGENQFGFGEVPGFVCGGKRCNTAKAFLSPVKDRQNLHVLKNAQVKRILINKTTKKAYGIELKKDGKDLMIQSKMEIILSAGAINSPHLLMLSGIGPKEHLDSKSINVIKDLRVGENFQDHFFFLGTVFAIKPLSETYRKADSEFINDVYKYLATRTGPLSKTRTTSLAGFIDTTGRNKDWPDIELINEYFPSKAKGLEERMHLLGLKPNSEYIKKVLEMNKQYDLLFLWPSLLRPASTGKILLDSNDPFIYPKLYPGYLQEQEDVDTVLRSVRFIQNFVKTDSMKSNNAFLLKIEFENCTNFEYDSDQYWECAFRKVGSTTYHQSGTCKMGPASDPNAVVDPKLRVYGVTGLRVVDASIMPTVVSGNTNAATIMIGEKASDIIKEDWNHRIHDEM